MPPRVRFTREDVLSAAFALVREQGIDALNARSVAAQLGSSTQPLFRVFTNMDEIRAQVIARAQALFDEYIKRASDAYDPMYKRTGMAYIRFAREEKNLYKLLFMRDRAGDYANPIQQGTTDYVMAAGSGSTGLAGGEMERFHMHMWVYVHGLATMIATGYLDLGDDTASALLSECYQGLLKQFSK